MLKLIKTIVFASNFDYTEDSGWEALDGPAQDLKILKELFKRNHYTVHEIKNSENVVESVNKVMKGINRKDMKLCTFAYTGYYSQTYKKQKYIEPPSRCGPLWGPYVWTHLRESSHVVTCVATPVDGSTHVDTYMSSCSEASCVDTCVSTCVSTPVPKLPQVCPHMW